MSLQEFNKIYSKARQIHTNVRSYTIAQLYTTARWIDLAWDCYARLGHTHEPFIYYMKGIEDYIKERLYNGTN